MSDGKKKKAPKYGGGGTPCHICGKSVFAGEALSFEKMIFHRDCFRCCKCKKKLKDSISNARHLKGVIYCLKCFKADGLLAKSGKTTWHKTAHRSTGGSGKYGGGGQVCVMCNKTVYLAEMIQFDKKPYHKKCLKCSDCNKKVVNANVWENKPFCSKCWTVGNYANKQTKITWKKKDGGNSVGASSLSSKFGGGGTPCHYCQKMVYKGETLSYEKHIYHPKCFMCTDCNKKMDNKDAGGLFGSQVKCSKCWKTGEYNRRQLQAEKKALLEKQESKKVKSSGGSSKYGGGSKNCHACKKKVFMAEQVSFEKKVFHAKCLICTDCGLKTPLDKLNMFEDRLVCNKCWNSKNYVSKQTSTTKNKDHKTKKVDSRFKKFGGGGTKCYICGKTVYDAELISFEKHAYHAQCFKCVVCKKKLKNGTAHYTKISGVLTLYCKKCFHEGGHNRAQLSTKVHESESQAEVEPETKESEEVAESEAVVEPETVENHKVESEESRPELT